MRAERAPHGRRGDETLRRAWRMSVAASALVLLVATPLRSTAQDWVYVAERGDNLWDLATEYLVSMRYWARFRALNDVPNPRRMPPGTVIRFPVEWLRVTAAPVEITQVAGQARIVRADASSEAAAVGATLGAGDRIVTGAAASAVLAFVDGSELLVRPSSDLTVEEAGLYGRLRRPGTRSRLGAGRIEGEVPAVGARPPRFEISRTAAANAVPRAT